MYSITLMFVSLSNGSLNGPRAHRPSKLQYSIHSKTVDHGDPHHGSMELRGLNKIKMDLCNNLDLDVLCLTETHSWREGDSLTIKKSIYNYLKWSKNGIKRSDKLLNYVIKFSKSHCKIGFQDK